jgi:MbtH protein
MLQRLVAALWFGSAVFLMLAASAAFRAAGNPTVAADVVGSMLTRWHYIALAAPLLLFALELRRLRPALLILLFTCVVLAATQSLVDLRIRTMRAHSPVAISSLDPDHPTRRTFGMLHGLSMLLLAAQALAAAITVIAKPKQKEEPRMSDIPTEDPTVYKVVENDAQQYSLWPATRPDPLGWHDAGFQGTKEECLAYIEQIWGSPPHDIPPPADTTGGGP